MEPGASGPATESRVKNREFESLTQVPFPGGMCRVWRTEESWEAACAPDNDDIYVVVRSLWSSPQHLGLALENLPGVAAIAITDQTGNGATLYPDWK